MNTPFPPLNFMYKTYATKTVTWEAWLGSRMDEKHAGLWKVARLSWHICQRKLTLMHIVRNGTWTSCKILVLWNPIPGILHTFQIPFWETDKKVCMSSEKQLKHLLSTKSGKITFYSDMHDPRGWEILQLRCCRKQLFDKRWIFDCRKGTHVSHSSTWKTEEGGLGIVE